MPSSQHPSRASLIWRWFLFSALVVVVVGHIGAGWAFANRIIDEGFTPPADRVLGEVDGTSLTVERVTYPSLLGEMDAWYIDGTRSQWIVHVHGKGGTLDQALSAAEALAGSGYHQLIIAYRNDAGQPSDPSGYYRYGVTEWEDLEAALAWAGTQGATEISVVGYSTGAAIALNHHFKTHSPLVRSMVFDSPNVNMSATVDHAASQEELFFGIPVPFTVTEIAKFISGLRISANWPQIDYLRRIDRLGVPTLVFHGTEDLTVPIETSRQMAARRAQVVDLVEVEGAGHLESHETDPALYEQTMRAFVESGWR